MKNFSSWMIVIFMLLFWVFRVVVALFGSLDIDFMVKPYDVTVEVILLFVVLLCVPFIYKRKLIGGFIYLSAYGWYFGVPFVNTIIEMVNGATLTLNQYSALFFALIGLVLPIVAVFDILFDKSRKANPKDKKTDWFYKNKEFDRDLDERADKNNYRMY